MRSASATKGNPWPRDMVLTIDDDPHQLWELLWVREAWGLHPDGDQPPLLVDAPPRAGDPDEREVWQSAWPALWVAAVAHAGARVDPSPLFDGTVAPADQAEAIRRIVGPTWRDRFGDDAFDESYRAWSQRQIRVCLDRLRRPVTEDPERRSLDALIPAWQAGLTTVVTLPCRDEYTRVVGDSTLLVTEGTREDPERYRAALEAFVGR